MVMSHGFQSVKKSPYETHLSRAHQLSHLQHPTVPGNLSSQMGFPTLFWGGNPHSKKKHHQKHQVWVICFVVSYLTFQKNLPKSFPEFLRVSSSGVTMIHPHINNDMTWHCTTKSTLLLQGTEIQRKNILSGFHCLNHVVFRYIFSQRIHEDTITPWIFC